MQSGEVYLIIVEVRDPKLNAIEFILKDEQYDSWFKLNHGNFRIDIPKEEVRSSHLSIPRDLVEQKAYLRWESKGKLRNSAQQEKQDYEDALRELQNQLAKGMSIDEVRRSKQGASNNNRTADNKERPTTPTLSKSSSSSATPSLSAYRKRHDVSQWLNRSSRGHVNGKSLPPSAFLLLVEKAIGGDNVILRQRYQVGNNEIVVLVKTVGGENHILVSVNFKSVVVLHWGGSKMSSGEWLAPPSDMLPERSKPVDGACQTYFKEMPSGEGFFQGAGDGKGIVKWLLDEMSKREKDAERCTAVAPLERLKILLQVILVANSLSVLNDVTAMELPEIIAEAAKLRKLGYSSMQ